MAKETEAFVILSEEGQVIAVVKSNHQVNKAIKQHYDSVVDNEKVISIQTKDEGDFARITVLSKDEEGKEITKEFSMTPATFYQ